MTNQVRLMPIYELLDKQFYIPAYQRGYRWEKGQVEELLQDIWEFAQKDKEKADFYCLQPIAVKKRSDGSWELIDGQQRLTTIFIILTYLKDLMGFLGLGKFVIEFQTRPDSKAFLENIDISKSSENIDFYYIAKSREVIENWFKEKIQPPERMTFLQALTNTEKLGKNVKVIWYEVPQEEDSINVFTRINAGKIPLTNSELIKALFLKEGNFSKNEEKKEKEKDYIRLRQLEISHEWDRIEYTLQDDHFWYFVQNGGKHYDTRIEYIFDLIQEKGADEGEFYTFRAFEDALKANSNIEDHWKKIKRFFMTIEEWYKDKKLYHLVGFLVNEGSAITALLNESQQRTKSSFIEFIVEEIKSKIDCNSTDKFNNLTFSDKVKVRRILLLFNIQTIINSDNTQMRFPFSDYKKEKWDIEHIHSQDSDIPQGLEPKKWLEMIKWYFIGDVKDNQEEIFKGLEGKEKILAEEASKLLKQTSLSSTDFEKYYNEVLTFFKQQANENQIEEPDGLYNLCLLDSHTNRSYKNAPFPIKRKRIIEEDGKGNFIPICTKNAFLKCYSQQLHHLLFWQESDANAYLSAIEETLKTFLQP